jgi:cytochrome c-type biogenesis protein CcmF
MDYKNEHLLPGQLGNFFIIVSLIASLAAAIAYFKSTNANLDTDKLRWKKIARFAFVTEIFSVIVIFITLFFIIRNHLFEYRYAWQHSSISLDPKYLLACFWEGQEGSFLLWSIWHCVLGLVVMLRGKAWEAPVMAVVSFMQFCLASMVIGIYVFGHRIGSNPFTLLRNEMKAPIFSNPDYLSFIKDGNDLNPLLQNYWMVIHPPVLFLGFASMTIPFAYAISGLWTKKYGEWIKPALPWALFAAAALGTGIMMGAMWAYESLTFGGYWAWDPVENASLVPWLILVSGIHTMLIFKHTARSLRSTFLFIILSFILVLYSTFLTRSGILGDSSVHAFTDLGMNIQLLIFLMIFFIPSSFMLIKHFRKIPKDLKEEKFSSREFWMFLGALVLLMSAGSIIAMTSIPVINKISGLFAGDDRELLKPLAIGENSEYIYNRIQIVIAVIIGLITGFSQYLKYKGSSLKYIYMKMLLPVFLAGLAGFLVLLFGNIEFDKYGNTYLLFIWLAVFFSVYTIVTNLSYIVVALKGRIKYAGASVAHIGFGLMLLGILISSSKKEVLSNNEDIAFTQMGNNVQENTGENITLVKGVKTSMDDYWVTYQADSAHDSKPLWFYKIDFESKDESEKFMLTPDAFVNYKGNKGLMSNPASKHFWDHDLFTYITSLPDPSSKADTQHTEIKKVKLGDTIHYSNGTISVEKLVSKTNLSIAGLSAGDTASVVGIKIMSRTNPDSAYSAQPILINRNSELFSYPDTLHAENLIVGIKSITAADIDLKLTELKKATQFVTLKVYRFPFISVLWIGCMIMVIGLIMSINHRINDRHSGNILKIQLGIKYLRFRVTYNSRKIRYSIVKFFT